MSHMKAAALTALCLVATAAAAQEVTCDNNPMKPVPFCKSSFVETKGGYYFFGTDDTGAKGMVVITFKGLSSSFRPDAVMVKLDSGQPYKIEAGSLRPDVDCSRYGCDWSIGVTVPFAQSDLERMAAAGTMLVSFAEGTYVSDPVQVDPQRIARWYREWQALRAPAP